MRTSNNSGHRAKSVKRAWTVAGLAGKRTRAVAITPPAGSVWTSRYSAGASPARADVVQNNSAQRNGSRPPAPGDLPNDRIEQPLVNLPHALQLSLGGEPLIEAFSSKFLCQRRPRLDDFCEGLRRPLSVPVAHQLPVDDQIIQHPNQGLQRHVPSKHVSLVVAPDLLHHFLDAFEIVSHQGVAPFRLESQV